METINYTPRAKEVLRLASDVARNSGSATIEPAHVAEALVELGQGVHWQVWKHLGFDIEGFQQANKKNWQTEGTQQSHSPKEIRYGKETEKLSRLAVRCAKELNHAYVGTEHQLLALLKMGGATSNLLKDMGLSFDGAQIQTLKVLDPEFYKDIKPITDLKASLSGSAVVSGSLAITTEIDGIGLQVLIDPGDASAEVIGEVFEAISALNRAVGGNGMIFVDCRDEANVYSGAGK